MPRLRFSIRELMLVMLSVGLALGWWIDHRQESSLRLEASTLTSEVVIGKRVAILSDFYQDLLRDQGYSIQHLSTGDISVEKKGIANYRGNLFEYDQTRKLPKNTEVGG